MWRANAIDRERPSDYRAHVRCRPPSMAIVSPVIHAAFGETRYAMSSAISSGVPGRPSGCVLFDRSRKAAYFSSPMPPRRWRLVTTTPVEESVEGTLVIGPGSIVFPFERYVASAITLRFEGGVATSIEGGREAMMLRDFIEFRNDRNCRRLAHLGWGTDHRARWDVLSMRGADGGGGAEARSIYGGVLLALGENRDLGGQNAAPVHIDLALRRARLELDGVPVVESGRVLDKALA